MGLWKKKGKLGERGVPTEAYAQKEAFIDLLIHDLSGPLSIVATSVTSLLQKSERYGPLTEAQRRVLERIARNTLKAQILVQEIIEITRSKEGLFEKEHFPIERVVRESILEVLEGAGVEGVEKLYEMEDGEKFKQSLTSYGIYVEVSGKWCHTPFCHDPKKVRQILRNLISNAMKYRRTRVDLSVKGEKDLLISVRDDGLGISPEDQTMLFQRFRRLGEKREGAVPGLGLGLAGVKALVDAMEGEIELESKEGIGTCFMVRLPPFNL